MVGKTVLNQSGSYDVYIKGRMKYKGMTFGNSGNTEFKEVNRSGLDYKKEGRESARSPQRQLEDRNVPRGIGNSKVYRNSNGKPIDYYNDGHYYGSGTQIRGQQLREQNKAWSAKRAQSPKGQNFWEGW
jgi:adenine specific DNA methylase Mod